MRYEVRIGTRRAKSPAPYLYDQPYRHGEDDGARIVHVGNRRPHCPDCGRGRIAWAEAGFVPWHRICSHCGSHWELIPLPDATRVPVYEEPTCRIYDRVAVECGDCDGNADWCEQCEGTGTATRPHPERRCNRADAAACMGAKLSPDDLVACACVCHVPPSMRPVVGYTWCWRGIGDDAADEGCPTRADIVALLDQPYEFDGHVLLPDGSGLDPNVVPVCWARRARFY